YAALTPSGCSYAVRVDLGGMTGSVPAYLPPDGGSASVVQLHLAELVAKGILAADDAAITFAHPLARDVAATGVPPADAAGAHSRFARAELHEAGPRRWRHAGSAGTHLAAAVRLRADATPDGPDRSDAIDLLTRAA